MNPHLALLALLATLPFSVAAATTSYTVDLSPKKTLNPWMAATGISASEVEKYTIDAGDSVSAWRGTWENISLQDQVAFNNPASGDIKLSVGNAASTGSRGNFAAVKFELPTGAESATLSFDITKASKWGTTFNGSVITNIYGFTSDGTSTVIGTWTLANANTEMPNNGDSQNINISLDLSGGDYTSYGLIFNAQKTAANGGMAFTLSNLEVTGDLSIPEPATATLGLIGLAALFVRRRRP